MNAELEIKGGGADLPFSYCGLLDDKVAQFYRDYRSEELFNRILAKSLFFGGGLYINDGYLFMNPLARKQMMDPESLLHVMLDKGFVQIFTRCASAEELGLLPETSKIDSHMEFAKSDEWKVFRQTWSNICNTEWNKGHVERWPPPRNHKLQAGFYTRLLGKEPEAIGLGLNKTVLARIQQILFGDMSQSTPGLNPFSSAARTKFEQACRIALTDFGLDSSDNSVDMRSLMGIANEAYHYAFGASLSHQKGKPVAVDTTISPAFDELINRPEIDYRKFKSIPSIGIPIDADLTRGKPLVDLMSPGTDAFIAKTRFISLFLDSLFVADSSVDTWATLVTGLADDYARNLSLTLNQPLDQFVAEDALRQLALAPSATGGFDAAATALPSVSTSFVTENGETIGSRVAQFSVPDDEKTVRWEFSGKEIIPQVTSLAFSKEIVEELLDDEFLFNDKAFRDDIF